MNNLSAEKLLLAGFIHHSDQFAMMCEYLNEDDFTHLGLQMIWNTIHSLYINRDVQKISKLQIMSEAKALGYDNFIATTEKFLDEILNQQINSSDIKNSFLHVKKAAISRYYETQFNALHTYLHNNTDTMDDIISKVENSILSATNKLQTHESLIHLPRNAREMVEFYANNPGHPGLDIGLPLFQSRAGGISNGTLTFIAASTKIGKSQFGLNIALRAAHKLGLPVLILDSELNEKQQKTRLMGMFAKIPYDIIESGIWNLPIDVLKKQNLDDDEIARIQEYKLRLTDNVLYEKFNRLPITYEKISGRGVTEAIPVMRRWLLSKVKPDPNARFPQCLIIYDYIKLAHIGELQGKQLQEYQLHGLNIAAFHDFLNKYNVPGITFGQTNREIDTDLNCIAGAKRISENVDSISLLKRKTTEELALDPNGNYFIRVFEARNGRATHGSHINYQVDPSYWDMQELSIKTIDFKLEMAKKAQEWKKNRDHDDDDDD